MPDPIVPSAEERVDVPPSEENGNLPVDAPDNGGNGLPPVTPPNPVDTTPPATPPTPSEPELFELPDGRKVDGATLSKEWKENFLPEFTRKSQALAAKEGGADPNINNKPSNPAADPNWIPQTYGEIIEAAKAGMIADMEARESARIAERKAIEDAVGGQLTELKTADPNLNENALFLHATKYGFRDLKAAYQNMSDMNKLAKDVKVATAKDIQKRGDPVSASPGATGTRLNPSHFSSAVDYLRAQTGS